MPKLKEFSNKIDYCLNNENGSVYIEILIISACSLFVGVGLFVFGKYVAKWFERPKKLVPSIKIPKQSQFNQWDS